MPATIESPSGKVLKHAGRHQTTSVKDVKAKPVKVKMDPSDRLAENKKFLANANVKAFIGAIAIAEGGGYDFKFGAVKAKKKDPWRFTDFSTHPGAGYGGVTTAAGMYQITIATWREKTAKMGLSDFSPETQDLLAVEILRGLGVIDEILDGDISPAVSSASVRWAALPQVPGLNGRHDQPFMPYDDFVKAYKSQGGSLK